MSKRLCAKISANLNFGISFTVLGSRPLGTCVVLGYSRSRYPMPGLNQKLEHALESKPTEMRVSTEQGSPHIPQIMYLPPSQTRKNRKPMIN